MHEKNAWWLLARGHLELLLHTEFFLFSKQCAGFTVKLLLRNHSPKLETGHVVLRIVACVWSSIHGPICPNPTECLCIQEMCRVIAICFAVRRYIMIGVEWINAKQPKPELAIHQRYWTAQLRLLRQQIGERVHFHSPAHLQCFSCLDWKRK